MKNQTCSAIHQLLGTVLRDGAGLTDEELLGCFLNSQGESAFAALVDRQGLMVSGAAICPATGNGENFRTGLQTRRKADTIFLK